jgi:hypothetical protein
MARATSVLAILALAAPARADSPPPVSPERASYWRYETTTDEKVLPDTLAWEGTEEPIGTTSAFYVETFASSPDGSSRTHRRAYYEARADGIYQLGWRAGTTSAVANGTASTTTENIASRGALLVPVPFQIGARGSYASSATTEI